MRLSKGIEKFAFFFLILVMMCHFISCLWIFAARNFSEIDGEGNPINWIVSGAYEDLEPGQLYITSFYFAVTTITTVGYGDIGGNSTSERIICFFLHLIGVLSYSFASGSLTNLIQNYDTINDENTDKLNTLNRIYRDAKLPQDLYYKLKDVIKNNYDPDQQREIAEFLDDLPYRAMVKTIMCIYQSKYECLNYLRDQSDMFLSWICPLLKQEYCPMDQYIFYDTDLIVEIYFLTYGQCGFVLPLV